MGAAILVLGDAHATTRERRNRLFAAYRAAEADVAFQAGDLGYYDLPIPTYFVGGNNEDFDVITALRHGRLESAEVSNALLLHSTAVDVAGLRVAGITGNYAPSRFGRSREGLEGDRRRHFVEADIEQACALEAVDVLLTHEAPHGLPVSEDYDVGCRHIDAVLEAVEPGLCLVGHHHEHAESTFGSTRVVSLAPTWESYYRLDPADLSLDRFDTPQA